MNMVMVWRNTHWCVRVSAPAAVGEEADFSREIPLEDFLKLPAVKYVIKQAEQKEDLGV